MTPVRLEPVAFGLESSTLPLSHCAPGLENQFFCLFDWPFYTGFTVIVYIFPVILGH